MLGKDFERFTNYLTIRKEWNRKYGQNISPNNINLTAIVAVKRCCKCGSIRKRMSRHHKGNEFLFACLLEKHYAPRYILFHPDDCDWLCDRCHIRAHVLYSSVVLNIYAYVQFRNERDLPIEFHRLERFRLQILAIYDKWIHFKKKKKKRKKRRITKNARANTSISRRESVQRTAM